ncbi:MAG: hypothetical protein MZU84_04425 [Sphingobacterium sp.]|nr:hypothetical protein [Sphingobacterium sp.]
MADGPASVILDQVANGVAVRMAVLYLLAGGGDDESCCLRARASSTRRPAWTAARDILIEDGRIARVDVVDRARRDGPTPRSWTLGPSLVRLPRLHRHARAPARARATSTRRRWRTGAAAAVGRRIHGRRLHAEHEPGERQRQRDAVHPEAGGARRTWRASTRSAPCRRDRTARSWPRWPTCATPAASPSPTTGARWRRRC